MAGVNWSHWYGFPGRQNVNGGCRHGQELTGSPMKMISAFGVGSRGEVNGGVALEREIHAGEVQSRVFVTFDVTRVPSDVGGHGAAPSGVGVEL